jgi:hypothetical protein
MWLVRSRPYLDCDHMQGTIKAFGWDVSVDTIKRTLHQEGLIFKQLSKIAVKRNAELRSIFQQRIQMYDVPQRVWCDE